MSQFIRALSNNNTTTWWFIVGYFLLMTAINISGRDDLTTIKEWECNPNLLSPNDPFLDNVYDMLGEIINETPAQPRRAFAMENNDHGGLTAYGYGNCTSSCSNDECSECLNACTDTFYELCGPALGARIAMVGCYMRYEDNQFWS